MNPYHTKTLSALRFKALEPSDIAQIAPFLKNPVTRSCDMTIGGIFLWADYFRYRAVISDGTLFLHGLMENDLTVPAFSVPVGEMSLEERVGMLRDYCRERDVPLRFSGVPEEMMPVMATIPGARIDELTDFADYIYDIEALATLTGKALAKKRNHVNRFLSDNPDYRFEPITTENVGEVIRFYDSMPHLKTSPSAVYESLMTRQLLQSLSLYPFEAWLLRTREGIVAFTVGEISGDTLHVHIEKMNHEIAGAGETINHLFAAKMRDKYPSLRYVNRQDDSGDPGLRRAKESYHPAFLLRKYNVFL